MYKFPGGVNFDTNIAPYYQTVNAVSSSCVTLKMFFLGLGLTVTEINIKKVQKQDLKNIKNVGMECQKVCKQGSKHIVKVSLQSPIPTSFYITVANLCENDIGMRLCKLTFTIISSLPCLHTFRHSIPTSSYIFNVFKSCRIIVEFEFESKSESRSEFEMACASIAPVYKAGVSFFQGERSRPGEQIGMRLICGQSFRNNR